MINCAIIEDESLAQLGLLKHLKNYPDIKIMTLCDTVKEFLSYQDNHKDNPLDLLFVDIELPGMSGIEFLRKNKMETAVILTTAYSHYALEGYELNVVDYLLKPISRERFEKSILKARNYIDFIRSKNTMALDFIFIRSEKAMEKVYLQEIVMVEAMRNYVIYHCEKRKLVSYNSLKNAEASLPPDQFVKVQKSFIVNKTKIEKIEKGSVYILSKSISLNRENRNEIIKRLTEGKG